MKIMRRKNQVYLTYLSSVFALTLFTSCAGEDQKRLSHTRDRVASERSTTNTGIIQSLMVEVAASNFSQNITSVGTNFSKEQRTGKMHLRIKDPTSSSEEIISLEGKIEPSGFIHLGSMSHPNHYAYGRCAAYGQNGLCEDFLANIVYKKEDIEEVARFRLITLENAKVVGKLTKGEVHGRGIARALNELHSDRFSERRLVVSRILNGQYSSFTLDAVENTTKKITRIAGSLEPHSQAVFTSESTDGNAAGTIEPLKAEVIVEDHLITGEPPLQFTLIVKDGSSQRKIIVQ